jgi:hypothetical protein
MGYALRPSTNLPDMVRAAEFRDSRKSVKRFPSAIAQNKEIERFAVSVKR